MKMLILSLSILPALAATANADHYRKMRPFHEPIRIDYRNNYGPGPFPGTFATYNGPASQLCKQSAANYRGQDGRLYPCR